MTTDTSLGTGVRWLLPFVPKRLRAHVPARALTPLETIAHIEGGEWAIVPEDLTVRRVLPPAA